MVGITSLQIKIEKRVLERIGHVLRMPEKRLTKIAVLGWLSELEKWDKAPGKKRKTILYWKKLLREAGIDWTEAGTIAQNRTEWKGRVMDRIEHLERQERQGAHHYEWEPGEQRLDRNVEPEQQQQQEEWRCQHPGCNRICKSKAGLRIHQVRMHEAPRKIFRCEKCGMELRTEGNWKNHVKRCMGERAEDPRKVRCVTCGEEFSKSNIARHRRTCEARAGVAGRREEAMEERGEVELAPRVYRAERGECPDYGRELAKTNMARHRRTCGGRQ